jgi:hypothetical protein
MTLRKWAAGIAAFVLLTVLASPSVATTYYVNGSAPERRGLTLAERDARAGTSSETAWGTLAKANATVKSGDVVIIERSVGANYTSNIDPACQDTASGWVTYIGALDHPEYATIAVAGGATLTKPYTSIKGVTFTPTTTFALESAWDSLQYCVFDGESFTFSKARYTYVGDSHVNGGWFTSTTDLGYGSPGFAVGGAVGNTFNSVHFTNLLGGPGNTGGNRFQIARADSIRMLFCVFDVKPGVNVDGLGFRLALTNHSWFRGCRWNFGAPLDEDLTVLGTIRDSVENAYFDCDTMIYAETAHGGTGIAAWPVQFRPCSDGWEGYYHSVRGVSIDSSYIHMQGVPLYFQGGMEAFSLTRSVVINENGAAILCNKTVREANTIDHNTLAGRVNAVDNILGRSASPVVSIFAENGAFTDVLTFTNNIVYSFSGNEAYEPSVWMSAVRFEPYSYDSTFARGGQAGHANKLHSDFNLYSYYGHPDEQASDTTGVRSIGFEGEWRHRFSWPGTNATLRAGGTERDTITLVAGVFADTVTVVAGAFADTVSVVAGVFEDSVYITLPAYLPLADSTFLVAVTRTVKTPPSSGKLPISRTTVTPPSSGKLPVVRTTVTPPTSGKVAASTTVALGGFLPDTLWSIKWCPGCDDSSWYGSPVFLDSTVDAFDERVGLGSLARGRSSTGGTIGTVDAFDVFTFDVPTPSVIVYADTSYGTQTGSVAFITDGSDTTETCSVDSVGGEAGSQQVGGLVVAFTPTGPDQTFHVPSTQFLTYEYVPDGSTESGYYYADVHFGDAIQTVVSVQFLVVGFGSSRSAAMSQPPPSHNRPPPTRTR